MAAERELPDRPGPGERSAVTSSRRRLWVSRSPGKVVVRYVGGQVLKGYADLDPEQPSFRLLPLAHVGGETVDVSLGDLKAVFFVRSFDGDPGLDESKDLYQPRPPGTRKVSVRFSDGEELVGYVRQHDRHRPGLFFTPLDRRSNNLRVFAVLAAVDEVRRLL